MKSSLIEVVEYLKAMPQSKQFKDVMKQSDPNYKQYSEEISDPIDLTSILMKLYNDEYQDI